MRPLKRNLSFLFQKLFSYFMANDLNYDFHLNWREAVPLPPRRMAVETRKRAKRENKRKTYLCCRLMPFAVGCLQLLVLRESSVARNTATSTPPHRNRVKERKLSEQRNDSEEAQTHSKWCD